MYPRRGSVIMTLGLFLLILGSIPSCNARLLRRNENHVEGQKVGHDLDHPTKVVGINDTSVAMTKYIHGLDNMTLPEIVAMIESDGDGLSSGNVVQVIDEDNVRGRRELGTSYYCDGRLTVEGVKLYNNVYTTPTMYAALYYDETKMEGWHEGNPRRYIRNFPVYQYGTVRAYFTETPTRTKTFYSIYQVWDGPTFINLWVYKFLPYQQTNIWWPFNCKLAGLEA